MAHSSEGRLVTHAYPVDDLVSMVLSGRIRIPSFQRGLKWTRADVIKLFDSMVKGYPVGNLLLWQRTATAREAMRIGALRIDAEAMDQAMFVVDGQQRLTSLANALTEEGQREPQFALSYDLKNRKFVPNKGERPSEIPLHVIFDLPALLKWFRDRPHLQDETEAITEANAVAKAIREFRVPVYVVERSDPDVLRDIFDRMNNYGRQLTRAEVFSALHDAAEGGVEQPAMSDFEYGAARLHEATRFGIIDENTMLLVSLARRGSNVSRDIRHEFESESVSEFPTESSIQARDRTLDALISAVRFLQDHAEVPHLAFLPYRYLLVALARFFAHFPDPQPATLRNLRRWFWRAAASGPEFTGGNITHATRVLCAQIQPGKELASVASLLKLMAEPSRGIPVDAEFRTNKAETRVLLAAMWARKPHSFSTGQPYEESDLLDALGEAPTAVTITPQLTQARSIAPRLRAVAGNRMIQIGLDSNGQFESPLSVIKASGLGLLSDASEVLLSSHFVDEAGLRLLETGNEEQFLEHRSELIYRSLSEFFSSRCEWEFEDTPPLAALVVEDERDDDFD